MHLNLTTYRNFLTIVMILLLLVPCSLKKELKQFLNSETSRQHSSENSRVKCFSFTQKQEILQKKTQQQQKSTIFNGGFKGFAVVNNKKSTDFYNSQKEKVPSYILFEQFLI